MALLRKIRSATLIEALVATVLIVIIFMVSSVILNNLLINNANKDTQSITTRESELLYRITHHNTGLPYEEEYKGWQIKAAISKETHMLTVSATNPKHEKVVSRTVRYYEE